MKYKKKEVVNDDNGQRNMDKNEININEEKKEKDKIEINENKNILEEVEDIDKDLSLKGSNDLLNDIFIKESCSLCNENLSKIKYICIICENTILCDTCGEKHEHPCLIYKTPFISSLKETYTFITKNYSFPLNVFSKKHQRNLSISLMGDNNICLRPNKGALIPIKVMNNNNVTINTSQFIILVKGNKLIHISYDTHSNIKISPNTSWILKLKCITPSQLCKEKINIELYSSNFILKPNDNLKIDFNIEINEDKDEEQLNYKLFYNEMVILYNKEHKQTMVSLLENELKDYRLDDDIIELFLMCKWNKKNILQRVSSFKQQK
jgi:hypothetical protein